MNSSSCNNPSIASYFLENDIDHTTNNISTKPNLDDDYSSPSSYTNFFINTQLPNSPPQHYYSEFDLSESLHLQHICYHLFSDNPHTTTTTPMEIHNNDHLFASDSPTVLQPPKPGPKTLSSSTNRSSKKDRHSKIRTAKGLRDRRMRLSLEVAKRFFELQDMLGYDKASQTVNWLLKSSLLAIKDLERERLGANYSSSTTESDQNRNGEQVEGVSSGLDALSGTGENSTAVVKVKKGKKPKTKSVRATIEKESRMKARDRARARTSQKRRLLGDTISDQGSVVRLESCNGDEIFASAPWNPSHLGEIDQFPAKPWGT